MSEAMSSETTIPRAAARPPRKSPGASLSRDHLQLEGLFCALLDAFREGDWGGVRAMWRSFEDALEAHFSTEERHLLPRYAAVAPAATRQLLHEHDSFRQALWALGVGVDLHMVNLVLAQSFIGALREHALFEDRSVYPWADLKSVA
jgi:hemerythrin-like domain-containing protein